MYKINEIAKISNLSVRTLQYYDKIGLLKPTEIGKNGYRYYDDSIFEKLQYILLFREIDMPLKEMKEILNSEETRVAVLNKQIELLKHKQSRLNRVIDIAEDIRKGEIMDFDKYREQAKKRWGDTDAYKEFEKRGHKDHFDKGLLDLFKDAENKDFPIKLKNYITENYYTCTDDILLGLADMYTTSEFKENIDRHAGNGAAEKASMSIKKYLEGSNNGN
ncbi:MAG: MerR family transcriptional regulator [Coriobacteriia bacterium]|nr:MerR family transcriptional regulator [Coriobacteriia bacterium]